MPKKPKKVSGSKTDAVKKATDADKVESSDAVSSVSEVKKAAAVGGAKGVQGKRGTTTMSFQEREKIFGMIKEEADKLFKKGGLPKEQREVIEEAVKMAVDSGLVEDDDKEKKKKKKQ